MMPRIHLLWPVLIALSVGACARQQQPAYYVDSATGQPVAMAQSMPQPQQHATAQTQQTPERGLYNTFYSQSSAPPAPQYQAPIYAQQQQQPAYTAQTYTPPAYKPAQQVAQAQVYTQPQTYAQPQVYAQQPQAYRQPAPQYYQPYAGGPYAAAPQANPYAQARWY
jgi:putative serine protease PepD